MLVPPSSPEYGALLVDIEIRLANSLRGSPPKTPQPEDSGAPTMILRNVSQTAIAAVSWIWKFELETGQSTSASMSSGGGTSLLLPFGLDERLCKLYSYWHVILPGSKRLIRGLDWLGDNTDVRPPQPDEYWNGNSIGFRAGPHRLGPLKAAALMLDGVFFVDGGFAGPDTLRTFDRVTADVEAHVEVAKAARESYNQGLSPAEIVKQIEGVTGPDRGPAPPPRPPSNRTADFRSYSLRHLASSISLMRQHTGDDDHVISRLMSWTGTPLPHFRRL